MAARTVRTLAYSLLVLLTFVGVALAKRMPDNYRPRQPDREDPPEIVRHDTSFKKVPGSKLEIRAVQYDGSTNGTLVVELRNRTKTELAFSAAGLYFVPDGDPDSAPQRLGAVGPMQIAKEGAAKELTSVKIAPGATMEVSLDVFCIDSHRASPSPANVFTVAKKRMPKDLTATIEERADSKVKAKKASGVEAARPAAKQEIQGEVWRSRDAKWIELDGEGSQEAGK